MKELEKELSQKTSSLSELKKQLKEVNEREERAQTSIRQLEDQVQAKYYINILISEADLQLFVPVSQA